MYSRICFHLLLSALIVCWLCSCEEKDVLYGESIDDYILTGTAKDDDARTYFAQKELACIDAKADFQNTLPKGYQNIEVILRDQDGNFETAPGNGIYAQLSPRYESTTGGFMSVHLATTIGYDKSIILDGCNERDTYFYVVVYSPDGSVLEDVATYSVWSKELPIAYEMAFESHNANGNVNDLSNRTVAGIAIRRGKNRTTNLRTTLGDTGYLAYLLRKRGYFSTKTPAGYYPQPEKYAVREGSVFGHTKNFRVNGYEVTQASFNRINKYGEHTQSTLFHLFNFDVNQTSHALARFGSDDPSPTHGEVRAKFNVIRRGRLLYSFYENVTLHIPNKDGVVNLELL
ncbi:hypothetical protein [Lewinella sp. IMCC34191]|uniref:hypothetical protein n=1 Tax=Lewinella sp. IMCC34191 TaxID=2259172 RepID=UPI000E2472A7|nr:hypothetical protein [Lewinella sp. IMCC34191]